VSGADQKGPVAVPLAGYGNRRGKSATGVHDDVYVKAIAIRVSGKTGVMVGADALLIPPEVAQSAFLQLAKEFKLAPEQIYLAATHTHSSLGGWGRGRVAEEFAGSFQPGAIELFANAITLAVRKAIQDLKPAAFGNGSFAAPEFVKNRLVGPLGKTDPEFSVLVFKQTNGESGIIGSYAAHATVLSGGNMEFSADYPGAWERAMEKAIGGTALFMAGAVGSQSPNSSRRGFEGVQEIGETLARNCVAALPAVDLTNRIAFQTARLDISLPSLNARITDGLRLRPWLAAKLLHHDNATFIELFRIEDCVCVGTPCDFSAELALGIKESLRAFQRHAVITSFNGDYIGYVIPSRYYHLPGYEPRTMSFFGPYVPDYLDEMARTMMLDAAKQ
jgi:neutral ceramidase